MKTRPQLYLLLIGASLAPAGCAGIPPSCAPGLMPEMRAELFFGRNVSGRAMVSEEEWRQFLDSEITARFPSGFSVADVYGQWRAGDGMIEREASKELILVLPAGQDADAKLDAIRNAYKRRFNQESVLLAETPVCAAF